MVKTNSNINFNFKFNGVGTFDDVNNEVIRLNSMLESADFPFIVTKRVYSISIELLYNVVNHGKKTGSKNPVVEFEVFVEGGKVYLKASNHINHTELTSLREVISRLNNKSFDELRKMKAHQIKNGGISERGGAGLGLIDIRMKSENPIEVKFKLVDDNTDWVTIESSVDLI